MKGFRYFSKVGATLALVLFAFTGCESTDSGGSGSHGSMYYGVGFYDGWYHGHYDDDIDVIVTPPRPPGSGWSPGDRPSDPRPSHPIARPPSNIGNRPSTMPSIPSAPRVSARGGGGRR